MKTQQHDQARELYFQAGMTKTEIAEKVGVSRKTIVYWSQQGNWDKLRLSARTMPSLMAEKCYFLMDKFLVSSLQNGEDVSDPKAQLHHAQAIHLLAATIKKLKNRSTLNESMERFDIFLQR